MSAPFVSAVVPTHLRPELAVRAVETALAQTLRAIEVVVVVDGRDPETIDALGRVADERLRVIVPDRNLGNGGARNLGIAHARAPWIAFLDDDDEWMPRKLEVQLAAARAQPLPLPIVSCHMIGRNELREFSWPRRHPLPDEPLSEYLFCRRSPFAGEGMVQTSTILVPRALLARVPFAETMPRFVDLDWILRADAVEGAGVVFPETTEPLSVWCMDPVRGRISNSLDGAQAVEWARAERPLLTRRAYASFLMTIASSTAARSGDRRAFLRIASEAFRNGRPSAVDVATHVANFALTPGLQRRAAALFARLTGPRGVPA